MRRPSLVSSGILAGLALGAWLVVPGVPPAAAGPGTTGGPSGTYVAEFTVLGYSLLGVANVHDDGTWEMSDQTDYGGIPGFESTSAPWRGYWEHTGHGQVTFVGLALNFVGGLPVSVNRITAVAEFESGFDVGHVETTQRVYTSGQDPLDPDGGTPAAPPLDDLPGTMRRLVE